MALCSFSLCYEFLCFRLTGWYGQADGYNSAQETTTWWVTGLHSPESVNIIVFTKKIRKTCAKGFPRVIGNAAKNLQDKNFNTDVCINTLRDSVY